MKKGTIIWIVVAVVVLGGIWYFYASNPTNTGPTSNGVATTQNQSTTTNTTTSNNPNIPANPPVLSVASSAKLGSYLVATNGMTLYSYSEDKPGVSDCTGQCAVIWPPYTLSSVAQFNVSSDISGTLGTILRSNGDAQVTYNGKPLYFFSQDVKPGDVNGQGQGNFSVVTP